MKTVKLRGVRALAAGLQWLVFAGYPEACIE